MAGNRSADNKIVRSFFLLLECFVPKGLSEPIPHGEFRVSAGKPHEVPEGICDGIRDGYGCPCDGFGGSSPHLYEITFLGGSEEFFHVL